MAIRLNKMSHLIPLAIGAVVVVYLGYVAVLVRSVPEELLVAFSLKNEPAQQYLARRELFRRIRNSESDGVNALSISLGMSSRGYVDSDVAFGLADELLALGVDVNGQTDFGITPLQSAIIAVHPDTVAFLLERCANPSMPMFFGPSVESSQMNALEMTYVMDREYPDMNYSSVIEVLERPDIGLHCSAQ